MTDTPDDAMIDLATRIYGLARSGDTAALVEYVRAGVPANLTNDNGDTLIMLAAYHGHAETVSALLAEGADPNRANDKGQTPIAGAVFKGEIEVVEALLAGGADPAAGRPSAVDAANVFGQPELLELFEDEGD
jgi:ankyrin repeat protein